MEKTVQNSAHNGVEHVIEAKRLQQLVRIFTLGFVLTFSSTIAFSETNKKEIKPIANSTGTKALIYEANSNSYNPSATPTNEGGYVAELQQLIRDNKLVEIRTTYNGSYGTSLLFQPETTYYYVALFQQKNFWRVIKVKQIQRADSIFNDFVKQTIVLSEAEIRKIKLEAQNSSLQKELALEAQKAAHLQADLTVKQREQEVVASRQRAALEEAAALEAQERAAKAELVELRKRILQLQKQNEAGLTSGGK